jgi:hypothetical protein
MLSLAPKFVLVVVLATLALFLFPAASGSFTATHGPTTALRALTYLRNLLAVIAAWIVFAVGMLSQQVHVGGKTSLLAGRFSTLPLSLRC